MRKKLALVCGLVALLAAPTAAAASCPRTSLGDVEDEVMCPVCGTPLGLATEAPQAQRERAFIQRLVDRCRSKRQIKRALVGQFGPSVLALPGDSAGGFDLSDALVYLLPALGLVLAGGGLALAALRWRRHGRSRPATEAPPPAGAPAARLESDLERYDL